MWQQWLVVILVIGAAVYSAWKLTRVVCGRDKDRALSGAAGHLPEADCSQCGHAQTGAVTPKKKGQP